jgi:hypothetical protein
MSLKKIVILSKHHKVNLEGTCSGVLSVKESAILFGHPIEGHMWNVLNVKKTVIASGDPQKQLEVHMWECTECIQKFNIDEIS